MEELDYGITSDTTDITVLLIEDDDIDAIAVERAFEKLAIRQCIRAYDCLEGLEILQKGIPVPYLILLDINTPRMNGFEFLQALRADKNLMHSIIFVLTTSKADADILTAYRHNVAGYMVKPPDSETLLQKLGMVKQFWRRIEKPLPSNQRHL